MSAECAASHLFVYGTLRSDLGDLRLPPDGAAAAQRLRSDASLVGRGRVSGALYAVSWYPALIRSEAPGEVVGEVWRLGDTGDVLAELDAYEGEEYRRIEIEIALEMGGACKAWAYIYARDPEDAPLIDSGDYAGWISRHTS